MDFYDYLNVGYWVLIFISLIVCLGFLFKEKEKKLKILFNYTGIGFLILFIMALQTVFMMYKIDI